MKPFFIITFFFGFILATIGCSSDEADADNGKTPKSIKAENAAYVVSLEELQPNDQYYNPDKKEGFVMNIQSVEIFPNMNYSIQTTITERNNTMIITLGEILKPDITLPALGPARTTVSIPENIRNITFVNAGKEDYFTLDITDKALTINALYNPSFISSDYSVYFRRPKNTFAFVCGTNTNNKDLREKFINKLTSSIKLKEYKFEGEGLIPWATMSDGHWSNFPTKFYTYSNPQDFEKAGKILMEFAKDNLSANDGVTMSLWNWDGKTYYSWILDVQY